MWKMLPSIGRLSSVSLSHLLSSIYITRKFAFLGSPTLAVHLLTDLCQASQGCHGKKLTRVPQVPNLQTEWLSQYSPNLPPANLGDFSCKQFGAISKEMYKTFSHLRWLGMGGDLIPITCNQTFWFFFSSCSEKKEHHDLLLPMNGTSLTVQLV